MKRPALPKICIDELIPLLIGVWRRHEGEPGPPDRLQTREFRRIVSNVKALHQGLIEEKNFCGSDYFAQRDFRSAYLLYSWILHYQEGISLLGELKERPQRVLDIGSGAAPFALAALKWGANEVIAVDRNSTILNLGAEICGKMGYPLLIRSWTFPQPLACEGFFDLIIVGHVLEDLFPSHTKGWEAAQLNFLQKLLSRLTPQGHLLLVESSLAATNARILSLRDTLRQNSIPIHAPCIWQGACPALQSKSVCFAQRPMEKHPFLKEVQRAADILLGSLKMSYLILRNPKAGLPIYAEEKLYRVISPPLETYMGSRYCLCGVDGKKTLGNRLKEHSSKTKAFEYGLNRGEMIKVEHVLEQGQHLDLIEGSELKIVSAINKPPPTIDDTCLDNFLLDP